MDFIFILAQILAFVACGLNVISMQCKKRKQILYFLILGNVVGAIGLVLLKAYAGALIQFVFGLQTLINYILEVKNKKNTPSLVAFYIILSIIVLTANPDFPLSTRLMKLTDLFNFSATYS